MAETKVRTPDGNTVTVQHPDDATDEQILAYAKQNHAPAPTKFDETVNYVRSMSGMKPGSALGGAYNPTQQMSGGDRVLAGAGMGMTDMGRGAGQLFGLIDQESIDRSKALDAPLENTPS